MLDNIKDDRIQFQVHDAIIFYMYVAFFTTKPVITSNRK